MFVCICRAVTDREIAAAVRAGVGTVEGIGERLGAGTVCGACRNDIAALLCRTEPPRRAATTCRSRLGHQRIQIEGSPPCEP